MWVWRSAFNGNNIQEFPEKSFTEKVWRSPGLTQSVSNLLLINMKSFCLAIQVGSF